MYVKMYFWYAFKLKGKRVQLMSYNLRAAPSIFMRTSNLYSHLQTSTFGTKYGLYVRSKKNFLSPTDL